MMKKFKKINKKFRILIYFLWSIFISIITFDFLNWIITAGLDAETIPKFNIFGFIDFFEQAIQNNIIILWSMLTICYILFLFFSLKSSVESSIKDKNEKEKKINSIKKQKEEMNGNIDDWEIDETVISKSNGHKAIIISKTTNSIQLFIEKNKKFFNVKYICVDCGKISILGKKIKFKCTKCNCLKHSDKKSLYTGIDCKNYVDIKTFNKQYKKQK